MNKTEAREIVDHHVGGDLCRNHCPFFIELWEEEGDMINKTHDCMIDNPFFCLYVQEDTL